MKLATLALALALTGCASLRPNADEWTDLERAAFAASIVGHGVDLASSLQSDERCVEKHVFLGDNPSNGALIGIKALALGIEYAIYNTPGLGENTHWFGFASGAIHFGVGVSNYGNDCYD